MALALLHPSLFFSSPQVILTAYETTEHLPSPDGDDGDGAGLQWDQTESLSASFFIAPSAAAAGGVKAAATAVVDTSGGRGGKGQHQNRVSPEPPAAAGPAAAEGGAATAVAAVAGAVGERFSDTAAGEGVVDVTPTIIRSASNSSRAPPALM